MSPFLIYQKFSWFYLILICLKYILDIISVKIENGIGECVKRKPTWPQGGQPDNRADISRSPPMGLERSEKIPLTESGFRWPLNQMCNSSLNMNGTDANIRLGSRYFVRSQPSNSQHDNYIHKKADYSLSYYVNYKNQDD